MNILVLDVGTSSMRGTLLGPAFQTLYRKQIKYQPRYGENGLVEQDPQDWLGTMKTLCSEADASGTVDAIAMTAQRSSLIPADENGTPLMNAIMWQDTRNRSVCDAFRSMEGTVHRLCGTGINTVYSGGKMAWLRQAYPDIYARTKHLFVIPDYLIWHLTGNHVTDQTYGSRSMLMDLREKRWSKDLLDLFGVEAEMLGTLIRPSSSAGTVTEGFARETGLPAGIPVISCGGDQQCAALGQGVFSPGQVSINMGTGAYLIAPAANVPEPLDPHLICNVSAVPGQYILESSVLTCGAALNWFLREFGGDTSMVRQALEKSPAGANGVTALPYFQGRANPDWNSDARAAFYGLSLSTTKYDMLRALLEAICLEIRSSLRQMSGGGTVREIRLSGGMSKTPELCQLMADAMGTTAVSSEDGDATTRGAWMSAAVCLGIAESWNDAWETARPAGERIFTSQKEQNAVYDCIARQMERLYDAMK